METLKCILERRSCRKFLPDMPDKSLVDQVINAGLWAASGHDKQPVVIIAVTNPEIQEKLRAVNAEIRDASTDQFYGAPVILLVLADSTFSTHVNDATLTLGNMMLAAHDLGLASCWINRIRQTFEHEAWQKWLVSLGFEKRKYVGVGSLALGYADGELPQPRPRKDGRVLWIE